MSSPLIDQLTGQHGYPLLDDASFDAFTERDTVVALYLSEDPKRYPEANDLAVVLPELANAFPGRFEVGVVDRALEPTLKQRYAITMWPCLVFLRGGRYLGQMTRIRDWSEYMTRIPEILDAEPGRAPGVGIPVIADHSSEQAHA